MDDVMREVARLHNLPPQKYIEHCLNKWENLSSEDKCYEMDRRNPYFLGNLDIFHLLNCLLKER